LGFTRGAFAVTEALADEIVSLPMYAELSQQQIELVVDAISSFSKTLN